MRESIIIEYIENTLSIEEKTSFEKAMASDEELRKEVELARQLHEELRKAALFQKLNRVSAKGESIKRWEKRTTIFIVFGVLLSLFFIGYLVLKKTSKEGFIDTPEYRVPVLPKIDTAQTDPPTENSDTTKIEDLIEINRGEIKTIPTIYAHSKKDKMNTIEKSDIIKLRSVKINQNRNSPYSHPDYIPPAVVLIDKDPKFRPAVDALCANDLPLAKSLVKKLSESDEKFLLEGSILLGEGEFSAAKQKFFRIYKDDRNYKHRSSLLWGIAWADKLSKYGDRGKGMFEKVKTEDLSYFRASYPID